jgi:hypothetical protein
MKTAEVVLRRVRGRKKENDGGVNSTKIYFKHICKYLIVSPVQLLHVNKILK